MQVFDCETGPQERGKVLRFFDMPPARMGDFDPAAVKTGNIKDEAKKAEKIAAEKVKHAADVACEEAERSTYADTFYNNAALKSHTGTVLVIGRGDMALNKVTIHEQLTDEADLLADCWKWMRGCIDRAETMVGFNIFGYDLPFMIQRSWFLGVDIPAMLFARSGRYVNWNPLFVDLMVVYGCGQPFAINQDDLCKAFDLPTKPDGLTGADFARLYTSGQPGEREKALDYLKHDIRSVMQIATRMGVV